MRREKLNDLTFLSFHIFRNDPGLFHAVTIRNGGNSPPPFHSLNLGINTEDLPENIKSNHNILCRCLGIDNKYLLSSKQVHKNRILIIDKNTCLPQPDISGRCFDGFDAIMTGLPEYTLMIRIADCVPIILFDPVQSVVAVAHAGWQGTLLKIVEKCIQRMQERFGSNPAALKCGIGPSIGKCCFNVQPNITDRFKNSHTASHRFITDINGRQHMDLRESNRLQLMASGVPASRIELSGYCTSCRSDLFFSHRREKGRTGRFAILAGLRRSG